MVTRGEHGIKTQLPDHDGRAFRDDLPSRTCCTPKVSPSVCWLLEDTLETDLSRTLVRVELPAGAPHTVDLLAGGQLNWVWAVGMPYRVLANPTGVEVMPQSPAVTARREVNGWSHVAFNHGLGYFASLQSFLTYSFGWTRHDLGLLWWYDEGCPVEDSRFALIKAVWDADGMLLRYLAWCVASSQRPGAGWLGEPLHRWALSVNRAPAMLSTDWSTLLSREEAAARSQTPGTSPWGMHLERGDHIGVPSGWGWAGEESAGPPGDIRARARLVGANRATQRATFVSDVVGGWYAALADLGAGLPKLSDGRNWRVDVFVSPIGYMGEYRRSRRTGLWFAGQHRIHRVGN